MPIQVKFDIRVNKSQKKNFWEFLNPFFILIYRHFIVCDPVESAFHGNWKRFSLQFNLLTISFNVKLINRQNGTDIRE